MFGKKKVREKYFKISEKRVKELIQKEIDWYRLEITIRTPICLILDRVDEFSKDDILAIIEMMKEETDEVFLNKSKYIFKEDKES